MYELQQIKKLSYMNVEHCGNIKMDFNKKFHTHSKLP